MTNHTINVATQNVISPDSITVRIGDTVTFENPGVYKVTVDLPNDLFGNAAHIDIDPGQNSPAEKVGEHAHLGDNTFDVVWTAVEALSDDVGTETKSGHIKVDD